MKRYLLFLILLVSSTTLWFATAPMRASTWTAVQGMIADDDWKSIEELQHLAEAHREATQANWAARAAQPSGGTMTVQGAGAASTPPPAPAGPPKHMVVEWDPTDAIIFDTMKELHAAAAANYGGWLREAWMKDRCVIAPASESWTCYPRGFRVVEKKPQSKAKVRPIPVNATLDAYPVIAYPVIPGGVGNTSTNGSLRVNIANGYSPVAYACQQDVTGIHCGPTDTGGGGVLTIQGSLGSVTQGMGRVP